MRIHADRVGAFPAREVRAKLGEDRRRSRVRRIDVQPSTGGRTRVGDGRYGVDRCHPGRPDRRDHGARVLRADQLRPHAESIVRRNLPQLEVEEARRFLPHRVRVLGHDEHATVGEQLAGDDGSREHPCRRGVLDVSDELGRQAHELSKPVARQLFQLLQRGRRPPQDPDLIQAGDEELRENARLGSRHREVGEEARALPVRQARQHDSVEIVEQRLERLGLVGRRGRQRSADRARLDGREHGELADVLEVGRDPLERERAVLPEVAHFASFFTSRHERVLSTCSFVSHARRACATPSSA